MVRPLLGARKSSVFSVPSRRAVFAEVGPFGDQQSRSAAHQRACAVARETSDPPRSISIFAFGIFSKIREVDAVLQSNRSLDGRVHEAHPELAFWRLNGARPLASPKKTEAGFALRRRLLIEAGLPAAVVNGAPPEGAARDDLFDALRLCRDRTPHTSRAGAAVSRSARTRRARAADGDLGVDAAASTSGNARRAADHAAFRLASMSLRLMRHSAI
jgi:predicted RNase H-like nuclease